MPFLNIQGKWFPLADMSAQTSASGNEVTVYDFTATLFHEGDDMVEAVESALDEYADEQAQGGESLDIHTLPGKFATEIMNANLGGPAHRDSVADFAPFKSLEPRILAHILLQFLGPNPQAFNGDNLRAVAEFADVLGPDWAQKLYHFAVKVTKIAD
jgi:hypothetical protein